MYIRNISVVVVFAISIFVLGFLCGWDQTNTYTHTKHKIKEFDNNNNEKAYINDNNSIGFIDSLSFHERIMKNLDLMHLVVFDEFVKFQDVKITVLGYNLTIKEGIHSGTAGYVADEINKGEYSLMALKEGGYIPDNSTVLDLGTNIGITAITIAKLFPTVRVIGIEPIPYNYVSAVANTKLNNVDDRVTIINAALKTDVSKPISMRYSIQNPGCSTAYPQNFIRGNCGLKGARDFNIFPVTVEELFNHFSITKVPLIKLDCEACEYDIIPRLPPHILDIFRESILLGEVHPSGRISRKEKQYVHNLFDGYVQALCYNSPDCAKKWTPQVKRPGG